LFRTRESEIASEERTRQTEDADDRHPKAIKCGRHRPKEARQVHANQVVARVLKWARGRSEGRRSGSPPLQPVGIALVCLFQSFQKLEPMKGCVYKVRLHASNGLDERVGDEHSPAPVQGRQRREAALRRYIAVSLECLLKRRGRSHSDSEWARVLRIAIFAWSVR
jgi:hypothetical protein